MKILMFVFLFLVSGCGAKQPKPKVLYTNSSELSASHLANGDLLTSRGFHLEASYYYEAALAIAEDERAVLRRLIIAQVRADRLRDARINVLRLSELEGSSQELNELLDLLNIYAPLAVIGLSESEIKENFP